MSRKDDEDGSASRDGKQVGKILPFRKPAGVQPTLSRRAGGTRNQHVQPSSSRKGKPSAAWKGKFAHGLQIALLLVALLLALKNCGKLS